MYRSVDAVARIRPATGPILVAIAVLHLACTPVFHGAALGEILDDGVIDAIEPGGTSVDSRAAAFWYLVVGLGWVLLGYLVWWLERRAELLPLALGWLLAAFALANSC
ncbi:MAG TPA: DUF6463 family protein [Cryptosporangiaceae bacterium]|nr:DUF6463 family protein [Cryptosporangiaceae bacterium]